MNMKLVIVLCTLFVYGLAARVSSVDAAYQVERFHLTHSQYLQIPKIQISTFRESVRAAANRNQPALGRIVNGQPATENQIPHQCAVLSPIGRAFSLCGGSIISDSWVLTGKWRKCLNLECEQSFWKCFSFSCTLHGRIYAI